MDADFFNVPWQKFMSEEVLSSLFLVAVTLLLRFIAEKVMRRKESFISDNQWRFISIIKTISFLIIAIGLFVIWAPSIKSLALSLTAFAVAIIIATKELIMCVSGAVVRMTSNSVTIGDWVEIDGMRGKVVDMDVLSTTLQEIHSDGKSYEFTGRRVMVPNSVFLSHAVRNETFYGHYVYHPFSLVFSPGNDYEAIEQLILASLERDMEPHIDVAKRYNSSLERKIGLDLQDVDPVVVFETTNEGNIKINVIAFLPTRFAVQFEQNAKRSALEVITKATVAAQVSQ